MQSVINYKFMKNYINQFASSFYTCEIPLPKLQVSEQIITGRGKFTNKKLDAQLLSILVRTTTNVMNIKVANICENMQMFNTLYHTGNVHPKNN